MIRLPNTVPIPAPLPVAKRKAVVNNKMITRYVYSKAWFKHHTKHKHQQIFTWKANTGIVKDKTVTLADSFLNGAMCDMQVTF